MLNIPLSVTAGLINFGSAEDYIIAAASTEQWSGNLLLGSEAHVFGSVAASNTLELGDGVIVDGDACAGTTNDWGASVAGATGTCADFNQLANDISGAATQAEGFSGSYLDNVSGSLEVFGGGFQSFSINNLLLSGGDALTVTGNVDDYFIFNIFGEAKLGSGSNILLQGGVTADNVVFNFVKNLNYQNFELGGANISGTFLSSGRTFIIGDGATLKNSRFYSTESIVANVQDVHFPNSKVSQVEVPEPTTLAIFVLGLMGLASRRFKENA
jgi:hypothetical protein